MTKREKAQLEKTVELLRHFWKTHPPGRRHYAAVATRIKGMLV